MRRSLPLAESQPTLEVRTFRPGHDELAWLEVNNRAFAHHPEQGGWSIETLQSRMAQPWFDPLGFIIHEADDRIAGFCWTKVDPEVDPTLGEIYVIAVDPDFHGRGLGSALVLAGLENMSRRGITEAMLFVDAENKPAVEMYERLGFRVTRTDRAFVGDIASTPDT
jgi:mycothiol synthase